MDGDTSVMGTNKLSVGVHKVVISHPCYESISFDAAIKSGGYLKFDGEMTIAKGTLSVKSVGFGAAKIPIYVDNEKFGTTPFSKAVPVCATYSIGSQNRELLPVKVLPNKETKYTYKLGNKINSKVEVKEEKTKLTDLRNNKSYKLVRVGSKQWMAENLNYKTKESACYENKLFNCEKLGRLYSWQDAQKACPEGWKLPTSNDVDELVLNLGSESNLFWGTVFSGLMLDGGKFEGKGESIQIWTATEKNPNFAFAYHYNGESVNPFDNMKANYFAIRCVKE